MVHNIKCVSAIIMCVNDKVAQQRRDSSFSVM